MQRDDRWSGWHFGFVLVLALAGCVSEDEPVDGWQLGQSSGDADMAGQGQNGCSDERNYPEPKDGLYSHCRPDPSIGCDGAYSCVARPAPDCPTSACAIFRNSVPFCTRSCEVDADCPNGACAQVVVGGDERYCVHCDEVL